MTNPIPQCDSTTVGADGKVRCLLEPGHADGEHRCAFKSWPESSSHAATAVCGCATNAAGLHAKECPIWINVGPNLAQRRYVRRDSAPERNTMTRIVAINPTEQCRETHIHEHQGKLRCVLLAGHDSTVHRCATATWDAPPKVNTLTGCLTGYGVEQATAELIRDDSVAAIIIREQVKIYCAWQDDPTRENTDGTGAGYELLLKALIVHGAAHTNQDSDRVLHKIVQAHRNGVRL